MRNHDRPGQSADGWKERQDISAEERARQFQAEFKERQDKSKGDLNDALVDLSQFFNKLTDHLSAKAEHQQTTVGVAHRDYHQDAVISADYGHVSDLALPATLATVVLVQKLTDTLKDISGLIDSPLTERGIDEISAGIAEVWDQFKIAAEQVIEDVKQQMTELLSPEKTQDQAPVEQHAPDAEMTAFKDREAKELADQTAQTAEREQETSAEIGGPQVDKDMAEIRRQQDAEEQLSKLQNEQEKMRDEQAAQVDERRDQLAKKYEDSPDQEKHLEEFEKAAEAAQEALARQQAAELQRLQEQQLQDRDR